MVGLPIMRMTKLTERIKYKIISFQELPICPDSSFFKENEGQTRDVQLICLTNMSEVQIHTKASFIFHTIYTLKLVCTCEPSKQNKQKTNKNNINAVAKVQVTQKSERNYAKI